MLQNQGGVIGGTQSSDIGWRNHGTAVTGVIGGDDNAFGITGICPLANVRAISIFGSGQSTAKAITNAADALSPGDIILIELHAPGPRFNFQDVGGQRGFIAMEFWAANFAAIVYATSVRGVIVVEAAGNGAENFDDPLYNNRPNGFPASWRNPFNLANPQSGAIIVGAGAPRPELTDAITVPTARVSIFPIMERALMFKAGDAKLRLLLTAICKAAPTKTSGTPTLSAAHRAPRQLSSAQSDVCRAVCAAKTNRFLLR
jgi:subtilisin family serine protease